MKGVTKDAVAPFPHKRSSTLGVSSNKRRRFVFDAPGVEMVVGLHLFFRGVECGVRIDKPGVDIKRGEANALAGEFV